MKLGAAQEEGESPGGGRPDRGPGCRGGAKGVPDGGGACLGRAVKGGLGSGVYFAGAG